MLSGKHSYTKVNGITKANATATTIRPQPILTIQERLQDLSLTHWHLPIDSALELHLHGRLTVTNPNDNGTSKTLAPDSWTKWPTNYCKIMLKLVQLVSAEQANELLTAKLAAEGFLDREIGTQPRVVREVVLDVKKVVGRREGGVAKFGHDDRVGGGVPVARGGGRGGRGTPRGRGGKSGTGRGQGGRGKVAK
jgi:hypothetical protein